jgi:acetylornithine/N-succinyldiaminopimelate aminotransferase
VNRTQLVADARVMPTYRRFPVTFVRGNGIFLLDDEGKEYLDFVAGVAVVALGHAHPAVAEAIATQAAALVHTSNLYYTEPMAQLAQRLCDLLGWPDGRVFFANSGAEANECAIKLIRKWSRRKYSPHRYETIAAYGSFHGRTFETLAATGQPAKWEPFSPLPPGFVHVPYNDPTAIEEAVGRKSAAVLLEPVLGEGGVVVPSDDYFPAVRKICDAGGLAFIADEVQTGLGRCGEWFAFQSWGAVPDVITLAKALGNGLPIGACVARGELAEAFEPGDHATTVGGGPVICAAALAVLETMDREGLIDKVRRTGPYLEGALRTLTHLHPVATEVRGKGLLLALQLSEDIARDITIEAMAEGLLVNDVTPSAIRLCPPLVVTEEQCDRAIQILDRVLSKHSASRGLV